MRDDLTLSRIHALAIPPAWTKVWISADAAGHMQATGRDAKLRKQYRYHLRWRQVRNEAKYHRLVDFCTALPTLRAIVDRDLATPGLTKRKVIATVVSLMERAQLRVGNDAYARQNGSYGATTLQDRHAKFHGDTLELAYRGKSGVQRRIMFLLCSLDHPGSERGSKRCVKQVLEVVSSTLGHIPAVCRSSYIHPRVIDDFTEGRFPAQLVRQLQRRAGDVAMKPETIAVDMLRAIEPLVARYLDKQPRTRQA